jgi:hypothetical protein
MVVVASMASVAVFVRSPSVLPRAVAMVVAVVAVGATLALV